jgi:S-adenosylmethionine-diacylglycerol 3-amino-3-carboxypropyl transferase
MAHGLFNLVYRHSLIYNQCWEDPALDRLALDLRATDRVLVITSAGCNALDYALTGARVVAVDANPLQNHLLELKLAAIERLDFDAFFALFGEGGCRDAMWSYAQLRSALSVSARGFWDAHWQAFDTRRSRGGSFYYHGTSGLVALGMRRYVEKIARVGAAVERLLSCRSVEEQIELYQMHIRRQVFRSPLVRLMAAAPVSMLLGVPTTQRQLIEANGVGIAGFMLACLERVLATVPFYDNYFWSVYLRGAYTRESCPEYLKPRNFAELKQRLSARVSLRTGTVTECLRREPEPFTAFVLLDHMDWLTQAPRALEEEWAAIFACAAPGARALFRSAGPDAGFLPERVAERLCFERERARDLHRTDRVGTYGSFHIARIAA